MNLNGQTPNGVDLQRKGKIDQNKPSIPKCQSPSNKTVKIVAEKIHEDIENNYDWDVTEPVCGIFVKKRKPPYFQKVCWKNPYR